MLLSLMLNTIEPGLGSTITYMEIAKDLWDDIKKQFSVGNGPHIHQLKTELVECKQQGMTIWNYCRKLKMIWEELGIISKTQCADVGGMQMQYWWGIG